MVEKHLGVCLTFQLRGDVMTSVYTSGSPLKEILPSGVHLAMSGDIFSVSTGGGAERSWLLVGRDQGCC